MMVTFFSNFLGGVKRTFNLDWQKYATKLKYTHVSVTKKNLAGVFPETLQEIFPEGFDHEYELRGSRPALSAETGESATAVHEGTENLYEETTSQPATAIEEWAPQALIEFLDSNAERMSISEVVIGLLEAFRIFVSDYFEQLETQNLAYEDVLIQQDIGAGRLVPPPLLSPDFNIPDPLNFDQWIQSGQAQREYYQEVGEYYKKIAARKSVVREKIKKEKETALAVAQETVDRIRTRFWTEELTPTITLPPEEKAMYPSA